MATCSTFIIHETYTGPLVVIVVVAIRARVYQNLTLLITTISVIPAAVTNCVIVSCSLESLQDLHRRLDRMRDFLISPCAAHVKPTFEDYREKRDPSHSATSTPSVSF